MNHAVLQTILLPLRTAKPDSSPLGHRMLLRDVPMLTVVQVEQTVPRWPRVPANVLLIQRITASLGQQETDLKCYNETLLAIQV